MCTIVYASTLKYKWDWTLHLGCNVFNPSSPEKKCIEISKYEENPQLRAFKKQNEQWNETQSAKQFANIVALRNRIKIKQTVNGVMVQVQFTEKQMFSLWRVFGNTLSSKPFLCNTFLLTHSTIRWNLLKSSKSPENIK